MTGDLRLERRALERSFVCDHMSVCDVVDVITKMMQHNEIEACYRILGIYDSIAYNDLGRDELLRVASAKLQSAREWRELAVRAREQAERHAWGKA